MKEKEEDLSLFLEMQKCEERDCILLHDSEETDASLLETKPFKSPISKIRADGFLNSENEKTDYDWLLTPPRDPLFPCLEKEMRKTLMSQDATAAACPAALNSRVVESATRGNTASQKQVLTASQNSSNGRNRRSSSAGRGLLSSASRPVTPTSRSALPSRACNSRASTPTSRTAHPSAKPIAPVRSSTPTRSSASPSTPTSRACVSASKSASRSVTPTQRVSSKSAPSGRSSSVSKLGPAMLKTSVRSRGTSPTQKSMPWKPSEMPGFSLDAPQNLRTALPERTASASRCRPAAAPSAGSSAPESGSKGRLRRSSCSPSRARAQPGNSSGRWTSPAKNRAYSNGSDNVSPVTIGTKMVERVVNMRKLAPPKQDDNQPPQKKSFGKPLPSSESSGFGRTLSKVSLEMALRHMDIGQNARGNLRPLITKFPSSLKHGPGPRKTISSRGNSVSGSPVATRSNASSEPSTHSNSHCLEGSEVEDSDLGSERGQLSPMAIHGR